MREDSGISRSPGAKRLSKPGRKSPGGNVGSVFSETDQPSDTALHMMDDGMIRN